jgi:hypothetical protein
MRITLSLEEWRLVQTLRELPPSPLRDRLMLLLEELVEFVREPHCPEMQADGVPCASAQLACDQCRQLTGLLDALRHGLCKI